MSPRLSIGLPVYNGAQYLAQALDALLSQSYRDFELIISDNASGDGTDAICRRYAALDQRIRYLRQPRNIGAGPNHNVVVDAARGELFKWASHDDLYHPHLLERCVAALDEYPDAVLASCLSAVIDESGLATGQAVEHPQGLDSSHAPERFAGVLFGIGGDDDYGVIRIDALRGTRLSGSHYHADRTLVAELALHGRFHRVPEELYFRRDLPNRAGTPTQSIRQWCVTHDPRRANRLRHPAIRLLAEYVWVLADGVGRASLTPEDKRRCYSVLFGYLADRMRPSALQHSAEQRGAEWEPRRGTRRTDQSLRVGLFGLLGAGNLGNDGSLEAVLDYLADEHPGAKLAALCSGPDQVRGRYGVAATRLHWYRSEHHTSGLRSVALKIIGKVVDARRTLDWVRQQDIVIVPGMGVLEATLPLRPWGFPYYLMCLCASARLTGTKVLLVSVGADIVRGRVTRWVIGRAASLAHYRSFRDHLSRAAMRDMGVDTTADEVYPDLAFALPTPTDEGVGHDTIGVGVMAYHGGNDDRRHSQQIERAYIEIMKRFVHWLINQGKQVRLFVGDSVDEDIADEIIADVRKERPDLGQARVRFERVADLHDLMRQMAAVDIVVATRYHNVLCALKLSKPTISLGYAAKNDELMASMGLGDYCQAVGSVDFDRLVDQFRALQHTSDQLAATMRERNRANRLRLEEQFTLLSKKLSAAPDAIHRGATAGGLS